MTHLNELKFRAEQALAAYLGACSDLNQHVSVASMRTERLLKVRVRAFTKWTKASRAARRAAKF